MSSSENRPKSIGDWYKDRAANAEQSARSALDVARFEWRNAQAVLSVEEGRRGDEQSRVLEVAAPF